MLGKNVFGDMQSLVKQDKTEKETALRFSANYYRANNQREISDSGRNEKLPHKEESS